MILLLCCVLVCAAVAVAVEFDQFPFPEIVDRDPYTIEMWGVGPTYVVVEVDTL